jgi:phosphoenolpyruvate carboxykinase (GTP)
MVNSTFINLRVIKWIVQRVKEEVDANKTAIGYVPHVKDVYSEGLNLTEKDIEKLLSIDKEEWNEEVKKQEEFFKKFGNKLPEEIAEEHGKLRERLKA